MDVVQVEKVHHHDTNHSVCVGSGMAFWLVLRLYHRASWYLRWNFHWIYGGQLHHLFLPPTFHSVLLQHL